MAMSVEKEDSIERRSLSDAKILMISKYGPGKIGGIPSVISSLEKVWQEYAKEVLYVNPENQSSVDLAGNWDLVVFHHTSIFGVKKFLELPERLREKSNFIWYQAVDEETLKTFARLGVGNTRFILSAIRFKAEIISRRYLANYPGVINYAISNNIRESLLKAGVGSGKEIQVVEAPSLLVEDREKVKEFEERGDGSFVVLSVSRISPEKGIENIIETYENLFRLVQNFPEKKLQRPVKFIIAGGYSNSSYFEAIVKKINSLPSNRFCSIDFVGKKVGGELFELYKNSHVFIMPGVYDSWGLVTIEALSYGLPVTGFNAPGTKEIFEKSQSQIGNLVDSCEMAAESIIDIMSSVELWTDLSKGALRESTNHDPKKVSLELLNKFWNDRYKKIK